MEISEEKFTTHNTKDVELNEVQNPSIGFFLMYLGVILFSSLVLPFLLI